jgi:uncharacterized membrane protein YvbJ
LNCPYCGKEISAEDATFCPYCGESLEPKPKSSDVVLAAAILTIVAAAFSAGTGYGALNQYTLLRKIIIISIIGAIVPLVAVFTPYLVVPQYQYGIVEIAIIIFAMLSGIFVITSRNEFIRPSVSQSV